MNFDERKRTDREYMEMIYSLITEMNGAVMAQVRNINNTLSNVLRSQVDIQNAMNILNNGLKETRDKRYQEEIDQLELQVDGMRRLIEEKKIAKTDTINTTEKIQSVVANVITQQRNEEIQKKAIPWLKIRDSAITAAVTIAVIWFLPQLGELIKAIFAK